MSHFSKDNGQSLDDGKKQASYKDAAFGEKLNILEGVIGYQFPSDRFQGKALADLLDIAQSQVSRKKQGKIPITNWELSKLIDLYRLGENFDFSLFKLPLKEFRDALKSARIGTYGSNSVSTARQVLLAEARPELKEKMAGRPVEPLQKMLISIEINRQRQTMRAGGFGIAREDPSPTLVFHLSERVYFKVSVPGPGHLYVLSDQINVEITCLMPSEFAEETKVTGDTVRVPTESGFFDVVGPPAYYRLFAIHSTSEIDLPWLSYDEDNPEPITVPELELPKLVEKLESIRAHGGAFSVAAKDYRVLQ